MCHFYAASKYLYLLESMIYISSCLTTHRMAFSTWGLTTGRHLYSKCWIVYESWKVLLLKWKTIPGRSGWWVCSCHHKKKIKLIKVIGLVKVEGSLIMAMSKKKILSTLGNVPNLQNGLDTSKSWHRLVMHRLGTAISSENSSPELWWDLNMLHPTCLSSATYRWYKMYFPGICGLLQSQTTFSLLIEWFITSNWELLTPYLLLSCPHTEMRNHPDMTCHNVICDMSLS